MIPGKISTGLAKFQRIVSVHDFLFPRRLQELSQAPLRFPEKFLFYIGVIVSTVLPTLVPLQRIDDCFEIHILQRETCDPQLLNHRSFRSGYDCTSAFSARSPCNFGSRADVTISVLREVRKNAFARGSEGNS